MMIDGHYASSSIRGPDHILNVVPFQSWPLRLIDSTHHTLKAAVDIAYLAAISL